MNNKAPGPSGITSEMLKALYLMNKWLYIILNKFRQQEKLPEI